MKIFKPGTSNDPRRRAATMNVALVICLAMVVIVALYFAYEPTDPCADRTQLTVEEIWACDGIQPERPQ
jgi:hypothetical protein